MWLNAATARAELGVSANELRRRRLRGDITTRRLASGRYEYAVQGSDLMTPLLEQVRSCTRAVLSFARPALLPEAPMLTELDIRPMLHLEQCACVLTGRFTHPCLGQTNGVLSSFCILHANTLFCFLFAASRLFWYFNTVALLLLVLASRHLKLGCDPATTFHAVALTSMSTTCFSCCVVAGIPAAYAAVPCTVFTAACFFSLALVTKTRVVDWRKLAAYASAFSVVSIAVVANAL
jgi:hypothetical protein